MMCFFCKWGLLCLAPVLLVLGGCQSIPIDERAEVRAGIESQASETLKRLMDTYPEFRNELQAAKGCFVTRFSTTKVPIIGGGYGIGVLYERETGHRTYLNVTRADLGVGLGVGQYRVAVLLNDQETLEDFRDGFWVRTRDAQN